MVVRVSAQRARRARASEPRDATQRQRETVRGPIRRPCRLLVYDAAVWLWGSTPLAGASART